MVHNIIVQQFFILAIFGNLGFFKPKRILTVGPNELKFGLSKNQLIMTKSSFEPLCSGEPANDTPITE